MIKDTVNTHFSKEFNGFVWRIKVDEHSAKVALEIRNAETKTTSFTCIDLENQTITIDELQLEEPWFCGIESISNGMLFLHYYVSETSPEHKGILAFNANNGEKLWENYTHTYIKEDDQGIIAYNSRIEPKRLVYLDKETGVEIVGKKVNDITSQPATSVLFPIPVDSKLIESFLADEHPENVAEHLRIDKKMIISFYVKENQTLTNYIRVFNSTKEVIWNDKMLSDIQNQGFDTFFVYKKYLLYIKNRSKFVGYFL